MSKPVSIVLPTYNEKDTIKLLLEEIAGRISPDSEIIVVDDDSPDGTGEIAARMGEIDPRIRVLRRQERGLTSALRAGVAAARQETVIWLDADFAHPPEIIPDLIAADENYDIVVASRYVPGGRDGRKNPVRRYSSLVLNRVGSLWVRSKIRDLSSGFVRARRTVLAELPFSGTYGDYCITFLVRAERRGYRIGEIPYTNSERERGYSKTGSNPLIFLRYVLLYLRTIIKLRNDRDE
ncbi:MAG: glycosyltransferase [Candidatus Erginobacter occultus]|nr:glycosyltransferase [Candidatus Erginobacter occultus]